MKHCPLSFVLCTLSLVLCPLSIVHCQELAVPRDSVPDDHLAWFGLRGPVAEVVEYDYNNYGKTVWRFDKSGRLTEYYEYTHPFFEQGGCVFGLWAHYRYAYDENGEIQFLETYNADYNTVDAFADLTLQLFPPQRKENAMPDDTEKEFGDTTFCYSQWKPNGEQSDYYGIRYDRYGNMIEDVHTSEDGYTCAAVRVREIKYYKDIDLFDLPVGVRAVVHQWVADGRTWGNRYDFDKQGNMTKFRSWVDREHLYEWDNSDTQLLGCDLIATDPDADSDVTREVYYWTTVPVGELTVLPDGISEENAFGLCFDYMGYAFQGSLYPLHNGWWVVLSYWCLDEMDGIYVGEDEDGEPIPAVSRYQDPFAGMRYPIIKTDSVSFATRNYGNQTIKMYKASDGKRVGDKLKVQCNVDVLDADPQTRRLLCRTNPGDWCWEDRQYVSVYGWMDEEWVCANLLTTCP
ncbi:MAG: hypothetical protein II551_04985 [Paludibacteraceae bacterium]|nr:hypothetical protein [Paludibacteraceae bacterium]